MSTAPSSESPWVIIAKVFLSLLCAPISAFMRGWAISVLWGWFVVPLGVPALSILSAIGLSFLVELLTFNSTRAIKDVQTDERSLEDKLAHSYAIALLLYPAFVFFGWIVHIL